MKGRVVRNEGWIPLSRNTTLKFSSDARKTGEFVWINLLLWGFHTRSTLLQRHNSPSWGEK